jgi:hypothetical protein
MDPRTLPIARDVRVFEQDLIKCMYDLAVKEPETKPSRKRWVRGRGQEDGRGRGIDGVGFPDFVVSLPFFAVDDTNDDADALDLPDVMKRLTSSDVIPQITSVGLAPEMYSFSTDLKRFAIKRRTRGSPMVSHLGA